MPKLGCRGTLWGVSSVVLIWVGTGRADFTDVGAASGVADATTAVGGLLWADLDGDGDLDALVNTRVSTIYFRNDGGDPPTFTDVTPTLALDLTRQPGDGESRSIVAADMNNDGIIDVVRFGSDRLDVYLGQGPDGSPAHALGDEMQSSQFFMDETTPQGFTTNMEGGGVLDLNGDGYLDIVLQNSTGVRFLQNPADGTADFRYSTPQPTGVRTSNSAGYTPDAGLPGPNADYMTVVDFDVDGFVDFAARISYGPDIHRQTSLGVFATLGPDIQADNANKGSIAFCDLDSDGDFDFVFTDGDIADPDVNHIFLFEDGSFSRLDEEIPAGADGLDCGDVDNDGDVDLMFSGNGEKRVLVNQWIENGGTAVDLVSMSLGPTTMGNGEGTVLGDYDRDGDLDAMVVLNSAPNLLLDNNTDDDNYLVVRVYADLSSCEDAPQPVHREDIGAVAILASESGTALGAREVNGGQGHGSQGTSWLHWGLADGPTVAHELTVHFQHGDHPTARLRIVPADLAARNADGYQLLEVLASDPDGDGISTLDEMMDAGDVHDLDGDGYPNWYDEDSDGDGISDADEAGDDDPCTPAFDRDDNGVLDYLEDGPVPDASVPDGAVPDGAAPDARVDAAPIDGGGMDAAALVAHGGGCAECTASGSRDGGAPAVMAWAVVLGLFALHRTRRRR